MQGNSARIFSCCLLCVTTNGIEKYKMPIFVNNFIIRPATITVKFIRSNRLFNLNWKLHNFLVCSISPASHSYQNFLEMQDAVQIYIPENNPENTLFLDLWFGW